MRNSKLSLFRRAQTEPTAPGGQQYAESGAIDTSSEIALQTAFQSAGDTLQEDFQKIGIAMQRTETDSMQRPFQQRSWNVKSAIRSENNRHSIIKIMGTMISVTAACLITLPEVRAEYRIITWIVSLALMILSDGVHLFDRFLAFQSRAILSGVILLIALYELLKASRGIEVRSLLTLAGLTGIGGLILILVLNRKWLAAEQWLMTEAGQTALLTDVDNSATRAWQAAGRRESRSLLYSLGMETTDNALDIIHRPIWLAGYLSAHEKIAKYKQRLEKLEAQASETERLKAELEEQRKECSRYYSELRDIKTELEFANREYTELQKENRKLALRNEQLLINNDELIQELENVSPIAARDTKKHEQQSDLERILDLIAQGESQAGAARIMEISKAKVSRMLKEAREAGQIPEDHPAYESHPIIKSA